MNPVPTFLKGNLEGCGTVASAWIRGLESAEEQILKWTAGLPAEGFWWAPAPDSNSIGGLLNHIAVSILRLGHAARGEDFPPELQKTTAEQLAAAGGDPVPVLDRLKAASAKAKGWLKGLSAADLEQVRELKGRGSAPAAHLWHKVVEHAHEHVGQVITLRKLWNSNFLK
jgi:uncharacterized damage-inducible protein DinB